MDDIMKEKSSEMKIQFEEIEEKLIWEASYWKRLAMFSEKRSSLQISFTFMGY